LYAALFTLKHPEIFPRTLCMSGRYRGHHFGRGEYSPELYFNDPLAFVPNLKGIALERVRQQIFLVLVVGRGPHEGGCLPETIEFARVLSEVGIPHHLAVWGADSAHEYKWWKKQALFYIGQMLDQKW
ncbi:MAG: esterase, partial [Deltaproteobacteria bacterium]|nr:esterase [Deltaproteobacteria bacterium]